MIHTIALDLEGTLISNAMSQIPRPGLYEFLVGCKTICERVVIFTTVREELFRKIASLLAEERLAPAWFEDVEYIKWSGKTKNLEFIPDCELQRTVLVDDFYIYVHPGQESSWIEICQFDHPYPDSDTELSRVLSVITEKNAKQP